MSVPIYRPFIRRKQMDSVLSSLVYDRLTPGEIEESLLKEVSSYLGLSGGRGFMENIRALEIYFDYLGLKKGDSILLSPLVSRNFLHAARNKGVHLKFFDVHSDSPAPNLQNLFSHDQFILEPEVKLVVIDSPLGFYPELDLLAKVQLPILLDLSHGMGVDLPEEGLGSYPVYIDLFQNPYLDCGSGALILLPDKKEVKDFHAFVSQFPPSLFLSDLNASLGIEVFKEKEKIMERQEDFFTHLAHKLRREGHKLPKQLYEITVRHGFFPVILESGVTEVIGYASKNGVESQSAFAESCLAFSPDIEDSFPLAKAFLLRCVLFPLYPGMSSGSLDIVSKVISTLP